MKMLPLLALALPGLLSAASSEIKIGSTEEEVIEALARIVHQLHGDE